MSLPATTSSRMRAKSPHAVGPVLARSLLVAVTGMLALVATVLAVGVMINPATTPLAPGGLIGIALVQGGVIFGLRLGWMQVDGGPRRTEPISVFVWLLGSAALLLVGVAFGARHTNGFAAVAFWTLLGAAEIAGWTVFQQPRLAWSLGPRVVDAVSRAGRGLADIVSRRRLQPARDLATGGESPVAASPVVAAPETALEDEYLPADVVQQLTRAALENGDEIIAGQLRASFAARQRSQSLHVAFCPPLADVPEARVVQLDGPRAQAKVGEIQVYGMRIDVRLAAASADPHDVLLQFEVTGPSCAPC